MKLDATQSFLGSKIPQDSSVDNTRIRSELEAKNRPAMRFTPINSYFLINGDLLQYISGRFLKMTELLRSNIGIYSEYETAVLTTIMIARKFSSVLGVL